MEVQCVNVGEPLTVAEPRVAAAEGTGGTPGADETWSESEGSERAAAST
jgi:hypothetical protein